MSESTPLCSGSRGFSSVNCCSLIPAILDSNLQRPRQYIQKHTHLRLHYRFIMQSAGFVSDLKKGKNHLHLLFPLWCMLMALVFHLNVIKQWRPSIPQIHTMKLWKGSVHWLNVVLNKSNLSSGQMRNWSETEEMESGWDICCMQYNLQYCKKLRKNVTKSTKN